MLSPASMFIPPYIPVQILVGRLKGWESLKLTADHNRVGAIFSITCNPSLHTAMSTGVQSTNSVWPPGTYCQSIVASLLSAVHEIGIFYALTRTSSLHVPHILADNGIVHRNRS